MAVKNIIYGFCYWGTIISFLINLTSCVPVNTNSPEDNGENESNILIQTSMPTSTIISLMVPSPPSTAVPSPMLTKTAIIVPSPSSTRTQIPPTAITTLTPTSVAWPTLTPLPTINPNQSGQIYSELMSSNGDCELPCWWGFHLGNTTIDSVRQFYISLGAHIFEQSYSNGYSAIEVLIVDPQIEDGTQVRHMFLVQDGVVIEAEIQVVWDSSYQIEPILQRLGQPSEVWMWTISEPAEGILPVSFRLYFPEYGALIGYGIGAVKVDDTVSVCFDGRGSVIMSLWNPTLWNPDGIKGLLERANETSELKIDNGHRPIEEVSNWNVEQFYTALVDSSHTECLETPSNLWRSP